MAKAQTKKRYTDTRRTAGGTEMAYLSQWKAHRKGIAGSDEPDFEEVGLVEVEAIQDGERVKILVYKDHVDDYKRVLEDADSRAAAEDEEESDEG